MPEPSILDARLAEIDRRLRTIQSGLEPHAPEPAPQPPARESRAARPDDSRDLTPPTPLRAVASPPPGPTPAEEADRLITRLRGLVAEHERLLAEVREALATPPARPAGMHVSVSAGPFNQTAQLRSFAQTVRGLSAVREVVVREYAGGDRAVIDVHLTPGGRS